MPDRAKEALFDILGSIFGTPGALPPVVVADLFAGSGSLGLEALSRGASVCYFFERRRQALKALRANVEALDAGGGARIMPVDAWRAPWARVPDGQPIDLLILDPPYRDSRDASSDGKVSRFLAGAAASGRVAPDAIALLHHEKRVDFEADESGGWRRFDARRYGTGAVTFFRRS